MREIKFRAWHTKEKCWWYFNLSMLRTEKQIDDDWFRLENLCQFTGFIDKNGKDIYEGDIVKYPYTHYNKPKEVITTVEWKYSGFYVGENQTKVIDSRVISNFGKILEVIGNIYEHKAGFFSADQHTIYKNGTKDRKPTENQTGN